MVRSLAFKFPFLFLLLLLYSICPIKFEIIQIDNDYQIVGKVNQYYEYYNDDIIDLIKDNYNKKIYIEFIAPADSNIYLKIHMVVFLINLMHIMDII